MVNTFLQRSSTVIRMGHINEYNVFDGVIVQGSGFVFAADGTPVAGTVAQVTVQGPLIPEIGSFRLTGLPLTDVGALNEAVPAWFTPEHVAKLYVHLDGVTLTPTDATDTVFATGETTLGEAIAQFRGDVEEDTETLAEGALYVGNGMDRLLAALGNDWIESATQTCAIEPAPEQTAELCDFTPFEDFRVEDSTGQYAEFLRQTVPGGAAVHWTTYGFAQPEDRLNLGALVSDRPSGGGALVVV